MDLRVLVVMAGDRRTRLLEQLAACGIEGVPADDCEGARRILRARRPVHVVLTDFNLPDGGWPHVLDEVTRSEMEAPTIICLPGLWVKVLEYGAYEFLTEPRDSEEAQRILEAAANEWWRYSQPAAS
jgi:DNA-binding NtrC family response regulator